MTSSLVRPGAARGIMHGSRTVPDNFDTCGRHGVAYLALSVDDSRGLALMLGPLGMHWYHVAALVGVVQRTRGVLP